MAEDIQSLLDKINAEGIEKAESAKEEIIAAAKAQAAKIVSEAKAQAEAYENKAREAAKAGQDRADAAIRQAARDAVIALRSDLLAKLNVAAKECIASAMTGETMSSIIVEMAKAYAKNPDGDSVELLLPQKEAQNAEAILKSALLAGLKAKPEIKLTSDFNAGLQISFKGDEVFFDFSDDALAEILCKFVGPKLASVIKG